MTSTKKKSFFNKDNAIIAGILLSAMLLTAIGVIITQCNKAVEAAQCRFVKPVAESVFKEKIVPYEEVMKEINENLIRINRLQKITIEIYKQTPEGEASYDKAVLSVDYNGQMPRRGRRER